MAHVYYHCGGVGPQDGYTADIQWQHYWTMTCGYKISALQLSDKKLARLTKRVERRVSDMAEIAADFFETEYKAMGAPPISWELHDPVQFGEYKGFAIGAPGPVLTLPPFPVYRDFLITYSFGSFFIGHEKASFLENEMNIQRYLAYRDVAKITRGEIHPTSIPYTPLEVDAGEP